MPFGNITLNIYKLLKRIDHGDTGGALLPIPSTRPPGFGTEHFNGHSDGFQSRCFGTRPLLRPSWAEEDRGLRLNSDEALHKHHEVTLRLLYSRSWEGHSQACADNCGGDSRVCCEPLLPSHQGCAQQRPGLANIPAFSLETAAGGEEF